jgi:hypothetical protein
MTVFAAEKRDPTDDKALTNYFADKVSTQLMLRYLFDFVASFDEDPDAFRAAAKTQLLELVQTISMAPISPEMEKDVRAFASQTISNLLTTGPRN